jgi:hypothetical protein
VSGLFLTIAEFCGERIDAENSFDELKNTKLEWLHHSSQMLPLNSVTEHFDRLTG